MTRKIEKKEHWYGIKMSTTRLHRFPLTFELTRGNIHLVLKTKRIFGGGKNIRYK